jgi:hypothetical protein
LSALQRPPTLTLHSQAKSSPLWRDLGARTRKSRPIYEARRSSGTCAWSAS